MGKENLKVLFVRKNFVVGENCPLESWNLTLEWWRNSLNVSVDLYLKAFSNYQHNADTNEYFNDHIIKFNLAAWINDIFAKHTCMSIIAYELFFDIKFFPLYRFLYREN